MLEPFAGFCEMARAGLQSRLIILRTYQNDGGFLLGGASRHFAINVTK